MMWQANTIDLWSSQITSIIPRRSKYVVYQQDTCARCEKGIAWWRNLRSLRMQLIEWNAIIDNTTTITVLI